MEVAKQKHKVLSDKSTTHKISNLENIRINTRKQGWVLEDSKSGGKNRLDAHCKTDLIQLPTSLSQGANNQVLILIDKLLPHLL